MAPNTEPDTALLDGLELSISSQGLVDIPTRVFALSSTLRVLDLSRNLIPELPACIGQLRVLQVCVGCVHG